MNNKIFFDFSRQKTNRESGFSILELLIAMFIGLFLLVGITSSYVSSKKSSIARDQYSILEDNGRLALEVMARTIQHTGYVSNKYLYLEDKFLTSPVVTEGCGGGDQSVVNPAIFPANSMTDNIQGDSIGVVYLGDSSITQDCSGGGIADNCQADSVITSANTDSARIYNTFYLDYTSYELRCAGSRRNDVEVIAEGIENIQFLYGVDTIGNDGLVDRYMNAADVAAPDQWNSVVSIQVAVLVRSLKWVKRTPESKTYSLLDAVVVSPNDRYQRAVFSTTVRLRNTK